MRDRDDVSISNKDASSVLNACMGMCKVCRCWHPAIKRARPVRVTFGGPNVNGHRDRGHSLAISRFGHAVARCCKSWSCKIRDSVRSTSNRVNCGNITLDCSVFSKPSNRRRRATFSPRVVERIRSANRDPLDEEITIERRLLLNCLLMVSQSRRHSFSSSGSSKANSILCRGAETRARKLVVELRSPLRIPKQFRIYGYKRHYVEEDYEPDA